MTLGESQAQRRPKLSLSDTRAGFFSSCSAFGSSTENHGMSSVRRDTQGHQAQLTPRVKSPQDSPTQGIPNNPTTCPRALSKHSWSWRSISSSNAKPHGCGPSARGRAGSGCQQRHEGLSEQGILSRSCCFQGLCWSCRS